jgi:hypothetical protein
VKNETGWEDLIGVIAIFIVFVLLPLVARVLKGKKRESPFQKETTQPESAEEEEAISEFDRLIQMRKTSHQKKPPVPEPPRIEPAPEPEGKMPLLRPGPWKETETVTPLIQMVKDLPDAAQAIIFAEIIGSPKALRPSGRTPFIFSP